MKLLQLRFMLLVIRYIAGANCHPDIRMESRMMAQDLDQEIRKLNNM